jgi:hypothetical protein
MPTARYTVIYESDGKRHKLCRIFISGDGSYYVTCPYHESDRVLLSKRPINYPQGSTGDEALELAVLDDDMHRLKLSHHPDGFVQFSGHGIRSGRHPDGSPRGIGLKSFPLSMPTAGPAFATTIHKPATFKEADAAGAGEVVFKKDQMFLTSADTGLVVEGFCFPPRFRRFVKLHDGMPKISIGHPSGVMLELRVLWGPEESWSAGFLGVDAWPCPVDLGGESGFAMSSPAGDLKYNDKKELEGVGLFASYPAMTSATPYELQSLAFPPRNDPPYIEGGPSPSAG